jgi:mannose-6-phosphate isomerase-like protein (cupin superfamily)
MRTSLLFGSVFVVFALAAPVAAQPASTEVKIIPNAQMAETFKKVPTGGPVIQTDEYKVLAARRDAAGQSEVHELDTDVIYVLEGTATFVTGGKVVDGKTTAPHEIRGTGLEGGTPHTVTKGDVIIVPRGVPHWFKEVPKPGFLYYVVKTVKAEGSK